MIDLQLIARPETDKTQISVYVYASVHSRLSEICQKEHVRLADLCRSLFNDFIADYTQKEVSDNHV